MLERPAAFNALLEAFVDERPGETVDARDGGARRGRPAHERLRPRARSAQPVVTAPAEALPTSAAYLASAPVASGLGGET